MFFFGECTMLTFNNGQQHCKDLSMQFVVYDISMQKHWYGPLIINDSVWFNPGLL